jgi:PAS domain S-box-containing protein
VKDRLNMQDKTRIEEVLRLSELRYRRLFEAAQDGILILDGSTGSIVDVNPFLLGLLGYSLGEFTGRKLWELEAFQGIEPGSETFESVMVNDCVQFNDLPLKTKDGRVIQVEFVTTVYTIGEEKTIQCTIRDITTLQTAENKLREKELVYDEQLRQAQKLENLGTLSAGVAHEFNNLLAMILPSAEMIAASAEIKSKTAVYVARIIEAANRGAKIVQQLSFFARSGTDEFKPTSLQRIVLEISSLLTHTIRKDIAIRTEITAAQSMVSGEIGLLHQAVLNLAVNAIDAMSEGGVLTLELADAGQDELNRIIDLTDPDAEFHKYVVLRVRDTGVGMDEKTRERIFEPFFTTKEQGSGTGLGLSIVHGIVNNHHGYLNIESTPSEGTVVSVFLPLLQHIDASIAKPSAVPISTGTETILVLDDEEAIRETVFELLTMNGYSVLTGGDGIEGMQKLRDHQDAIHLVITDLGMPRMNGEQFFTAAKVFNPALKIIITTGYIQTSTRSKLLALGVTDMIPKPFSIDTLIPAVRRALDQP